MRLHTYTVTNLFFCIDIADHRNNIIHFHVGIEIIIQQADFIRKLEIADTVMCILERTLYKGRLIPAVPINVTPARWRRM